MGGEEGREGVEGTSVGTVSLAIPWSGLGNKNRRPGSSVVSLDYSSLNSLYLEVTSPCLLTAAIVLYRCPQRGSLGGQHIFIATLRWEFCRGLLIKLDTNFLINIYNFNKETHKKKSNSFKSTHTEQLNSTLEAIKSAIWWRRGLILYNFLHCFKHYITLPKTRRVRPR